MLKKLKIKSLNEISRRYILLFGTYESKELKILYYLLTRLILYAQSVDPSIHWFHYFSPKKCEWHYNWEKKTFYLLHLRDVFLWNFDQKNNLFMLFTFTCVFRLTWMCHRQEVWCLGFFVCTGGDNFNLLHISVQVYFCNWEWVHTQTNTVLKGNLCIRDICWTTDTYKHWMFKRILSHTEGNRWSRK